MKHLKTYYREHKKMMTIILILLVCFICISAMSAVRVANLRAAADNDTHTSVEQTKSSEKESSEKVALTKEQKKLIENYDDDTKSFIETLSSAVWSTNDGRNTIRFKDESYTETINGKVEEHPYAIERLDKTSAGSGTTATIVFNTDSGTHVVNYSEGATGSDQSEAAKQNATSTITSTSMFSQKNITYIRAKAVKNISIKGLNSEVVTLFGGDEQEFTKQFSNFCALHYPSVTEATWSKSATIDWEKGTVITSFTLNDANPVPVTCTYNQSSGEFSFEG